MTDHVTTAGWAAGGPRQGSGPAFRSHVRDLLLAVTAAVLLAVGAGVVVTGGLMSSDPPSTPVVSAR